MKRIIVLILACLLAFATIGCEESLKIVDMKIEKYPNRIVYYTGIDNKLDLTGGLIRYILKAKDIDSTVDMMDKKDMKFVTIINDIDFNTPGVYVVQFKRGIASCELPIQVVDIDQIPTKNNEKSPGIVQGNQ